MIGKWNLMRLKSFCMAKVTIIQTKPQAIEWEKIFTTYTANRGLTSEIYKELKKWTSREQTIQFKNGVRKTKQEFSKEEHKWLRNTLRNCSTSLDIKEMQIKMTLRLHLNCHQDGQDQQNKLQCWPVAWEQLTLPMGKSVNLWPRWKSVKWE